MPRRPRVDQGQGSGQQRVFRPRGCRHPVREDQLRVRAGHRAQVRAVPAEKDTTGARAKNIFNVTLPAGSKETPSTAKYSLVLYINETGEDQTSYDSGATYSGTFKVTSSDGSNYMTGAVVTQVSP